VPYDSGVSAPNDKMTDKEKKYLTKLRRPNMFP